MRKLTESLLQRWVLFSQGGIIDYEDPVFNCTKVSAMSSYQRCSLWPLFYDTITHRHEIFSMQKVSPVSSLMLVFVLKCAQGQDLLALKACTRLGDDAARLSCYDAAMGVPKTASGAAKPQSAPPAETVGTEPQAKFGDDGRLHTVAKTPLPKNLSAQVREVALLPAGRYRLTLDNGQVWDTTQADSALVFKANDAVTISRGWLGSYQISLTGHNASVSAARKQ